MSHQARAGFGVVAALLALGPGPMLALHDEPEARVPPGLCLMIDYVEPSFWKPAIDEPIEVRPDGSFSKTSDADNYFRATEGGPAVDVGNGVVAQNITEPFENCGPTEKLLVVDCKTAQAILLTPPRRFLPEQHLGFYGYTTDLQPPHGPISLRPDLTIRGLAETAEAQGIGYTTDVMRQIEWHGPQNRWSPLQGCRIFYPGTKGGGG